MTNRTMDQRVARALGGVTCSDQGHEWVHVDASHQLCLTHNHRVDDVPLYSSDIDAAWYLVMHLTASDGPHADRDWSFGLEYSSAIDWVADFTPRRNHPKAREYPAFQRSGITPAAAIVAAFLAAVEVTDAA